jgi:hypothetical protein
VLNVSEQPTRSMQCSPPTASKPSSAQPAQHDRSLRVVLGVREALARHGELTRRVADLDGLSGLYDM